jgi:hypothetical protein
MMRSKRGLAAARGAEQRDQFARGDVEADVAQRVEVAELLADVADFDAHGSSFNARADGER